MKAILIFCNNQQHQQQRQQLPSNGITTAMAWSNIYNRYWSCLCYRDSVCNFKITFFIDLDVASIHLKTMIHGGMGYGDIERERERDRDTKRQRQPDMQTETK